jgi:hypothetical protein
MESDAGMAARHALLKRGHLRVCDSISPLSSFHLEHIMAESVPNKPDARARRSVSKTSRAQFESEVRCQTFSSRARHCIFRFLDIV